MNSDLKIMDLNVKVNVPLVEQVYGDLISPSAKIIGNNLAKICEATFNAFPIAKIHLCNCSRKVLEILSNKINNIREENLQIPDTHLFMKSIECLQYRDDKDLITQMFINLITNECDKTKAEKVHPALIEILNKMSKEEAMYLYKNKSMLSFGSCVYPIMLCNDFDSGETVQNLINSEEFKVLSNLSSYGLLSNQYAIPKEPSFTDEQLEFPFIQNNLLFLLLENIPDNLELEINEK